MTRWNGWIYFGFTVALFIAFMVIVAYAFSPKRKAKVEGPKYRMLEDDDQAGGGATAGSDGKTVTTEAGGEVHEK